MRRLWRWTWVLSGLLAGAAPSPGAERPNVLLITVDALRADHLGMYGYHRNTSPRVDAWFTKGAVFERAYSTEANTSPSLVSILTGLLPQDHGVRLLYQKVPPGLMSAPKRLGAAGYQTAAVVSNIVLTKEALGMEGHFHAYDDFVDEKEPHRKVYERGARPTTDAAIRWLTGERDPTKPHFLWVHYIDPHGPYHPPPSKPREFSHEREVPIDVKRVPGYQREPGVSDGQEYIDLYDEEIAYTDHEIGRLLDRYVSLGLAERTLILFTADHGESMMEHEKWFTHGYHVYEEIVRVPLAMTGPGIPAARIAESVSNRDIAPTVLAAARLKLTETETKRRLSTSPGVRNVFAEATGQPRSQWRTLIRGTKKWMVALESRTGKPVALRYYDLAEDSRENRTLPWKEGDLMGAALLDLCRRDPDRAGIPAKYVRGTRLNAPKVAPDVIDSETLERLKALGYVED